MATKDELKAEIERLQEQIKGLRRDLSRAYDLVDEKREQVEDSSALIESWIEVFDMEQDDGGLWLFDPSQSRLWDAHMKVRHS